MNVSAERLKYYGPRQLFQASMRLKKKKKNLSCVFQGWIMDEDEYMYGNCLKDGISLSLK